MKIIPDTRHMLHDDAVKLTTRQLLALKAKDFRRKAVQKRQASRLAMHLARHLPDIPHVQLATYVFDGDLSDFHLGMCKDGRPVLRLRQHKQTEEERRDRLFYKKALSSIKRVLQIRKMERGMTGGYSTDPPRFFYEGVATIGGKRFTVKLEMDMDVPEGCTVHTEQRRSWSDVITYSTSCRR